MTHELPDPLTPADCNLRDFSFTPVEFDRLFESDTWKLSSSNEKVAALYLWGKSWKEVPAGSIPANDNLLADMSRAGTGWKKVKDMALRNWVLCSDGRYYHPVMCEKVLESWLEKLAARASGSAGNASRWGTDFDPAPLYNEIMASRALLANLNPKSKSLGKKMPKGIVPESRDDRDPIKKPSQPDRDPIPDDIGLGSQETGTGTGILKTTTTATPARPSPPSETGHRKPFAMPLDWRPDPNTMGARMMRGQVPATTLTDKRLGEFVSYWSGQDEAHNQGEWEHKLLQRLQQIQAQNPENQPHGQYPETQAGGRPAAAGRKLTPVERVAAAAAAAGVHLGDGQDAGVHVLEPDGADIPGQVDQYRG